MSECPPGKHILGILRFQTNGRNVKRAVARAESKRIDFEQYRPFVDPVVEPVDCQLHVATKPWPRQRIGRHVEAKVIRAEAQPLDAMADPSAAPIIAHLDSGVPDIETSDLGQDPRRIEPVAP